MAPVAGASILSGVTHTTYKPHSNSSKWFKKLALLLMARVIGVLVNQNKVKLKKP